MKPFVFANENKSYKVCVLSTGLKTAREYIRIMGHKGFKYLGKNYILGASDNNIIMARYPMPEPSDSYMNSTGMVKCKDVDGSVYWSTPYGVKKHGGKVIYDELSLMKLYDGYVKGEVLKTFILEGLPDNICRCINEGNLKVEDISDNSLYTLDNRLGWIENEDTDQVWTFKDYFLNVYLPNINVKLWGQ